MGDDLGFWGWIHDALGGPGRLRFVLQPLIAILLGLHGGRLDARAGKPPYLWGLLTQRETRGARLKEGLRAAAVPFGIAVLLDSILQYYFLGTVRPGWAVVVGTLLVAFPYVAARAVSNRIISHRRRRSAPPVGPGPVPQA